MALVYATVDDLLADNWLEQAPPGNVEALLRSASRLVRAATRTAIYDVTPAGLPVDSDIAGAFRDATCAQVAAWVALDVDPTAGAGAVTSSTTTSSIGSASITREARAGQDDERAASVHQLVPDAAEHLDAIAYLIGSQPITW